MKPLESGLVSGRENHRERLIRGALECLRKKGYARTTARDIAAVSGCNLGSIGYHFGSKDALLNEAIGEGFAEWTDQLGRIAFADVGATPLERLRASWVAVVETFEEHRPLMVAFVEALAQAERSEKVCRELADLYEASRTTVGRLVDASLGDSGIGADHIRTLASFLIALCDGLLLQWLVDTQRAPSGEELIAALEVALPRALAAEQSAAAP
jgi:AcrR family transcriptional regulator